MNRFLLLSGILLMVASCDVYKQDSYQEHYVVESYLIALESFPDVRLSTTVPVNAVYDSASVAVSNASVVVNGYDQNGQFAHAITYSDAGNGVYTADDQSTVVMPLYRYELNVSIPPAGHLLTAFTIVPDTFSTRDTLADTLQYQGTQQFETVLTRSFYPGRQTIYVVSTTVIDPSEDDITPFWANAGDDPSEFYTVSSGLINESNYDFNPDNTITLRFPWIGIAFYGRNRLNFYAVDDNIYDFVRSASIQQGGSTLSPGEIDNVIYNVEGGIGVFGSKSRISRLVTVTR